jgi:hypothetical protein
MHGMVRIGRVEAVQDQLPHVRLIIAIRVFQK